MVAIAALAVNGRGQASDASARIRVMAQTGGALTTIGRGISINDRGDIGFIAATEKGHNVFCINGETGERRALMNAIFVLKPEEAAPSQTFNEYVQINNQRELIAQRRMNAIVPAGGLFGTQTTAPLTYIERWPWDGNRSNAGRVGLPNFLAGWETMKEELAGLPARYGTAEQQRDLEGKIVSYVSNWPSSDGWIQAILAVTAIYFAPGLAPELLLYAAGNMDRARENAEEAAERIVADLHAMGLLTPGQSPRIHLIGHSRGGAVNSRVARLLHNIGQTPAQYTALDGYSTDWPIPSDILADLDIVAETSGIPGMIKKNVRVDDGFDELIIRLILHAEEAFAGEIASWLGRPAPHYADAQVAELKKYLLQWKAPIRPGFDNYTLSGCAGHGEFTHHMSIIDAYTFCSQSSGLRALMDGPLGMELLGRRSAALAGSPEPAADGPPAAVGFRDGDFEATGAIADGMVSKTIPAGLDPVVETFLTAMKRPEFVLSSSWDLTGNVTLVADGTGHAARLDQAAGGSSLSQKARLPATATTLEFDLKVLAAKPDDSLRILAGSEVLGTVPLGASPPAHVNLSLFGFAGALTTVTLRLDGASGNTPAAITVDNIRATSNTGTGEPRLTIVFNPGDGSVDITLTGSPGRTYRVQTSSDLKEWTDLDSPMNFTGSKTIHDSPPSTASARFYRVIR